MASESSVAKRANLVASRVHWSHMDLPESAQDHEAQGLKGSSRKDSVKKWLTTTVTEEDAKQAPLQEAAEPLRRNPSCDDDLALGVEASLYGNQGVRTVQEFLRWSRSSPALSRWNSFSSATSGHSGPLSVMDILNLWNDDPEEVLLDLGFGCDEPDLSGRIPARFINHQSQARGINLQVFLEAQKNRLDLENPDVSNRFRQLEVLQQVTTAFSSLMGSSCTPLRAPHGKDLPPEAWERRRRMGMLFRRASKKSLSQIHNNKTHDPGATPESLQSPLSLGDKKFPLKRVKPGLQEIVCLSPLAEEQGAGPDPQSKSDVASLIAKEGAHRPWPLKEGHPVTTSTFSQRKKSPGKARESFEMEEIHSFDESSVTGSYIGGAEHLAQGVIRTNSCQSDSSGFLEELFIPSLSQQASPGSDLIKALSGLSGGSTDSQSSEKPGPRSQFSPPPFCSSSPISSGVDKSPCPSPEPSLVFYPPLPPVLLCFPKSDMQISEMAKLPDQDPPCSSSPKIQDVTPFQYPTLPSATSLPPTSSPIQPASLSRGLEDIKTEDEDPPSPYLSILSHDSEGTTCSTFSNVPPPASSPSPTPNLNGQFSASMSMSSTQSDSSSGSPGNTQSEQTYLPPTTLPDFHCLSSLSSPPLIQSLSQRENNQKDSFFPDSSGLGLSDPLANAEKEEETPSSSCSQLDKDNPLVPPSLFLDSSKSEMGCATLPCLFPNPPIPVCPSALSSQLHDPDVLVDPAVGRISDLTEQSISQQDRSCFHEDDKSPSSASPVQDVIHVKTDQFCLDSEDTLQRNRKGEIEVDGSEGENGDVDAFFQQLDTEGRAYWAEPIQVSSATPVESGSFEASDGSHGNSLLPRVPAALDSFSSMGQAIPSSSSLASINTDQTSRNATASSDTPSPLTLTTFPSPSATPDVKPSICSVSVQMSSSPSSHIIHRKDIPYVTDSKHTLLPSVLPLDTSTPFRAVQSWTDLQIQRNTLTKKLSYEAFNAVPSQVSVSMSALETMHRPTVVFSSSPVFPLLCNDRQPQDCHPVVARSNRTVSVSADKGQWSDEEEEVDRNGNEDEGKLWEGNQTATMEYQCSCDHQCHCCTQKSYEKRYLLGNIPYSLDELEEMMLCLQQFCSVLNNMEEQLSEDQAAVYSALSDQDREKVRDIEELRRAVKQEVAELEMQLNDLAHHYDDSLKMKMHRLLDEQSLLCSQLRVFLPGAAPTSLSPAPNRTVATQCSLLPWISLTEVQSGHITCNVDSPRQSPPGSESICEGLGCSPAKADKLDIVGFLQRLKESLRQSVNTDSLE
ncbi:serine-rich adhesin for platelets isoform X2 [Dicentrarchus labrax]|uniref:serine-rich adhesin for platelets isoform X2 n=1 Tax=Dicentrarchus labrax TaxID=13489 RepID=UPI0021F5E70E|nr:serine-rich adhesin for platelets isoform X2 [Dicentrarchus labrax]